MWDELCCPNPTPRTPPQVFWLNKNTCLLVSIPLSLLEIQLMGDNVRYQSSQRPQMVIGQELEKRIQCAEKNDSQRIPLNLMAQ